jgi:hypothetical protein
VPQGVRPLLATVCLAGSLTFSLTTWRLLDSPFRFDETEFAAQADAITRHGVPKIPYGESRRLPTDAYRARNGADAQYGMWHPPLYLYSLAVARGTLGPSNWTARSAGLAWFVLTIAVVWCAAGRASPGSGPVDALARATPIALAVLSPLVAHGVFYLDIDNTSLAFGLMLFGWVFTAAPRDQSWRRIVTLSAVLLLCLWSKMTTPYILLLAVGAFCVLDRHWSGILQTILVGALATAAFSATYLVYCRVTGYPADFMFQFSYLGKRAMYLSAGQPSIRLITDRLHAVWWHVVWFSPALTLLLLTMTCDRARNYWVRRRPDAEDFWIVFSWTSLGAYAIWGGLMGKYTFPAAVAAAIGLGRWLPRHIAALRWQNGARGAAALLALLIFHIAVLGPLEVKAPSAESRVTGILSAFTDERNLSLMATVAGFGAFVAIGRRSIAGVLPAGRLAALLLMCTVVANTVNCFKLMTSLDDRSPYRAFRERGFGAVVRALNERVDEADIVLVPKDIGFYAVSRYYDFETVRDYDGVDTIAALVRNAGITRAADSIANPALPDTRALLSSVNLPPVAQVDDFQIYGTLK